MQTLSLPQGLSPKEPRACSLPLMESGAPRAHPAPWMLVWKNRLARLGTHLPSEIDPKDWHAGLMHEASFKTNKIIPTPASVQDDSLRTGANYSSQPPQSRAQGRPDTIRRRGHSPHGCGFGRTQSPLCLEMCDVYKALHQPAPNPNMKIRSQSSKSGPPLDVVPCEPTLLWLTQPFGFIFFQNSF